jgi:hypothetical protein
MEPSPSPKSRKTGDAVEELSVPLSGCSALSAELEWNGEDTNDLRRIVLSPLRI